MAAATPRRVFGDITSSRLSNLSATKNSQNALTHSLLAAPFKDLSKDNTTAPSNKRPWTPQLFDDNSDSENVDPSIFGSKRSKASDGTPKKCSPSTIFNLNVEPSARPSTPSLAPLAPSTTSTTLGAASAPAGRSPKHKRVGILRKRSSLTPGNPKLRRIAPPTFCSAPFSIDAALSGTFSRPAHKPQPPVEQTAKPMPKTWFFDIHEDTPDEEAANIMEHETCTLDISSDDERVSGRRVGEERGKENVPPPDFVAAQGASVREDSKSRLAKGGMDEDRAPLSSLEAKEFYGVGLDERSVEVVREDDDKEKIGNEKSEREGKVEDVPAEEKVESFAQSTAHFAIAEDGDATPAVESMV